MQHLGTGCQLRTEKNLWFGIVLVHLLLCSVSVTVVDAWAPTWEADLPLDVELPAVFSSCHTSADDASGGASTNPLSFSDAGTPQVLFGSVLSTATNETIGIAQRFFPLQDSKRDFAVYPVSDLGNVSGSSSVVTLPNGTVLSMSMCNWQWNDETDVVSRFEPKLGRFVPVWVGQRVARNASCLSILVPVQHAPAQQQGSQLAPNLVVAVAVVGGVSAASDAGHLVMGVSLFLPSDLRFMRDAINISLLDAPEGREEHEGQSPPPLRAVVYPAVQQSSDHHLVVAGGIDVLVDPVSLAWRAANGSRLVIAIAPLLDGNLSAMTGEVIPLPSLPWALVASNPFTAAGAAALHVFTDTLYFAVLEFGQTGVAGALALAPFDRWWADRSSSESSHGSAGSGRWVVQPLGGPPFDRLGASIIFLPLQHEGCVLALFAIGGLACSPKSAFGSVSYTVLFAEAFVPSLLLVPYTETTAAVAVVASPTSASYNITVAIVLLGASDGGELIVSSTSSCTSMLSPIIPYNGDTQVYLKWTVDAEQLEWARESVGRALYVCYSDNESIVWSTEYSSGSPNRILFTPTNLFEPLLLPSSLSPAQTPPAPTSVLQFLKANWYYFATGSLGLVTVVAVAVSIRVLRRKGLRRGLSTIFNETSPLLDSDNRAGGGAYGRGGGPGDASGGSASGGGGRYDPLRISTNSHSARYTTIAPLRAVDGEASDVTFLVQRRRDNAMLVMKYIVCDGDIERLLSIREFEALNILQGHPNVVQYVDMFMNYAFSLNRLARTRDTQHILADAQDPTDGSLNTGANLTVREQSAGLRDATTSWSERDASAEYSPRHSSSLLSPKLSPQGLHVGGSGRNPSLPPLAPTTPRSSAEGPRPSMSASAANNRYVCLVMEYMPQGNIAQFLMKQSELRIPFAKRAKAKLSPDEVPPASEQLILSVVLQINNLLKFMHGESEVPLAHKGLKPENVLVSGPMNTSGTFVPVALSDFGFSVLGNFTPPSRLAARRRDSNELDGGSDCGSRSSMSQPMDTTGYLQSPKCDMWCLGCLILSLCTFRFGKRFPLMADLVATKADRVYEDIQAEMRSRGYSRELTRLTISLLHGDEKLRPSADSVQRMFARQPDGTLSLTS